MQQNARGLNRLQKKGLGGRKKCQGHDFSRAANATK